MKKLTLIIALTMSSLAFSAKTKKVIVEVKDYLTSVDSKVELFIGKETSVDCNGPFMLTKNVITGYDLVADQWEISADYYMRKTLKYCEGDVPVKRTVYAPVAAQSFSNTKDKVELTIPEDVDVYVKVVEVVKFEKVK